MPFRPDVIAGFRTPENVAELRELLRLVVDVCTPLLAAPLDDASIEVTFRDGTMALVELFDDADTDLTTYRLTPAEASFVDRMRDFVRRMGEACGALLADRAGAAVELGEPFILLPEEARLIEARRALHARREGEA